LQDSYGQQMASTRLLNMRGHHNSNDHSEGAEEAENSDIKDNAPLLYPCRHHLRADAEGDGGPMDGDRQEELPHARVGLLQAYCHSFKEAVDGEGKDDEGGSKVGDGGAFILPFLLCIWTWSWGWQGRAGLRHARLIVGLI